MTITLAMPEIDFGQMESDLEDFHDRMRILREAGHRVVPVRYMDEVAWLILRYEDVAAAFEDEDRIPASAQYLRYAAPSQGRVLLTHHGEEHRWRRALGMPPFLPGAIRARSQSLLEPLANTFIDKLEGLFEADLVEAFTKPYPFSVINHMLGFAPDDEAQVLDWVMLLFRFQWEREAAIAAKAAFDDYTRSIVEERRKNPQDDIISYLAQAQGEGGQALSDAEIFDYVRMFYPAGAETTYRTLGAMMSRVLSDPGLYERLIAYPEERAAAVEEILRLDGGVGLLPRYTERPLTIAGVEIPANSRLFFGIAPANRDPAMFDDPDVMNFNRKRNHLAFGRGGHSCLGSHLAREEMRVTLSLMLDRLPGLRLTDHESSRIKGSMLRGSYRLPVAFDEVLPA